MGSQCAYRGGMDNRAQVRESLISRRERISPAQAGLPAYGGSNRRVKGLRREEVALLAGVSIDYYVRMERENLTGASEAVLDGIASALQLDDAERAHLFDLARAAQPAPPRQRRRKTSASRTVSSRSSMPPPTRLPGCATPGTTCSPPTSSPALFTLRFSPTCAGRQQCPLRLPRSRRTRVFRRWERAADDIAAMLRSEAGSR